jgi:hypothetical protein
VHDISRDARDHDGADDGHADGLSDLSTGGRDGSCDACL